MKRYKYIALSMGFLACGLSSCNDFLDKNPSEWVEISTEDDVTDLLKGSYPDASYQWLAEIQSDNIIDNNCPHVPYDESKTQNLVHYNLTTYDKFDDELFKFEQAKSATYNTNDSPNMVWSQYYSSVTSANYALQAIEQIGGSDNSKLSDKLKAAKGEALLIRALDHFILVNLFCQPYKDEEASKNDVGVAYVTTVSTNVQQDYPRGTVTETYQKIKADLVEGLSLVNDTYYDTPKYHFNVNAAHAFAARVYLYTHEWDKVVEHANAVLGTGTANMDSKLMDYSIFDNCSSSDDYSNAWQNPSLSNNLMLLCTYSLLSRHAAGYRYATNGLALREIFYHSGPTWSGWRANPTAFLSGSSFYRSDADYGFFPAKVIEQFEYTDKVAGIGYVHSIVRLFTATDLILERAEAKVMLGDYDGAIEDICIFDKNRQNFSAASKATYAMSEPTPTLLLNWYDPVKAKTLHVNCFENWDFTQKVSASYVIPAQAVPYMNAINDMRRLETWFEGLRYFDMKRWGMTITHAVGVNSEKYVLEPGDQRLAVEVPWEALSAGVQASRESTNSSTSEIKSALTIDDIRAK